MKYQLKINTEYPLSILKCIVNDLIDSDEEYHAKITIGYPDNGEFYLHTSKPIKESDRKKIDLFL